jgi:hypothetical protein
LLSCVQKELEKCKKEVPKSERVGSAKQEKIKMADNHHAAFQELYELTQRKFLKQVNQYCEKMSTGRPYPRLFCVDYIDFVKIDELNRLKNESSKPKTEETVTESKNDKVTDVAKKAIEKMRAEKAEEVKLTLCIRPMCEFDEGWHVSDNYFTLENNELPSSYCTYLARLMNILKNGNLATQMQLFTTPNGQKLMKEIESKALIATSSEQDVINDSYVDLRKRFTIENENKKVFSLSNDGSNTDDLGKLDLERCELKNGKTMWLCKKHIEVTNARPLADDLMTTNTSMYDLLANKMLEDLEKEENFEIIL